MKTIPLHRPNAFSLVELLSVVAVMALLTSLLTPAFSNLGKAASLSTSGNKIVNLINYAGQNSTSKNAMTALIAVPDPNAARSYRSFALFDYAAATDEWKQITPWETLRDGIIVDQCSFTDYPAQKPQPDLPTVRFQGRTVSDFKYLIFLPNRSLLHSTPAQLRLAEGVFAQGSESPTYTRAGGAGNPANYYHVTVLGPTGRPKIDQP